MYEKWRWIPLSITGKEPFCTGVGSLYPIILMMRVRSSPRSMSANDSINGGQSGPSNSTGMDE